jgi:hypothetical protein
MASLLGSPGGNGWVIRRPVGEDLDEIYIVHVSGRKLAHAFGVEDNMSRMRQFACVRKHSL